MLPAAFPLIDQTQENFLSLQWADIHDLALHILILALARGGVEDLPCFGLDNFNPDGSGIPGGRSDQETRPGMGDFKGNRSERSRALVRSFGFIATGPEFTHMAAGLAWLALDDGVALDGLACKCITLRLPVLKRPLFKSQIQRFAIGPQRMNDIRFLRSLDFRCACQRGFAKVAEANVAELNLGRPRPCMQLEGQPAGIFGGVRFMVIQRPEEDTVDPRFRAGGRGPDAVGIPIIGLHVGLK